MSFSEFYLLASVHPLIHSGPTQLDFTEEKKDWGNIEKLCGCTVWSLPIFFLWTLASKHILCLNCLESICTINGPIQAILLSVLDPGGSKLSFQHWPPPCSCTLFSRMFLLTFSSNLQPLVLLCSSPWCFLLFEVSPYLPSHFLPLSPEVSPGSISCLALCHRLCLNHTGWSAVLQAHQGTRPISDDSGTHT